MIDILDVVFAQTQAIDIKVSLNVKLPILVSNAVHLLEKHPVPLLAVSTMLHFKNL